MFFSYSLLSFSFLLAACFGNRKSGNTPVNLQDTVVVAASQASYSLSKSKPQVTIRLKMETGVSESKGNYLLQFSGAKLQQMPDGAFEVYLSNKEIEKKNSTSASPYFAGVIDTYTLNSGAAVQSFFLDVSDKINNKLVSMKPEAVVTILFRGNVAINSSESADAGGLSLHRVALIRTN
jgi:excinuclease UvrABC helicase subunit UvrB